MAYVPPVNIPSLGGRNYAGELYGMFSGVGDAFYQNRRDKVGDAQWQSEQDRMTAAQGLAQSNADRNYALELKKLETDTSGADNLYAGTSMDAQNWNVILAGPSDPRYGAAYNQLFEQPKLSRVETPDGVSFVPQMPVRPEWVVPPSGGGGAGGVVPQSNATGALGGVGGAPALSSGGLGAPIPVPGTRPRPTVEETKGNMLIANIEQDYARLSGPQGLFGALDSPGETFAGRFGTGGRFLQSPDYQIAYDSAKNIVQSYIYAVSGAQAPDSEVERNLSLVLPSEADSAETIAVKRQRLDGMMNAIRAKAHQPIAGQPQGQTLTTPGGVTFQKVGQ